MDHVHCSGYILADADQVTERLGRGSLTGDQAIEVDPCLPETVVGACPLETEAAS